MSDTDFHDHDRNGPGSDHPYADDLAPALPGMDFDLPLGDGCAGDLLADPPQPVNWNLLAADEAQTEWLELDRWVCWLRRTYGLPASVVPPLWHRHSELVWELSALHLHWLCAYHPQALGTAPVGWHREFAETRHRLRDWVAVCGTRSDFDRPTPQATWPGEPVNVPAEPMVITNRHDDFARFVTEDVARRRRAENEFYSKVAELADHDLHDGL
jgi:hypothetical protein